MTAYLRDSFSVNSPGTKQFRENHDRIFTCGVTGEKKSQCAHCKAEAEQQHTVLAPETTNEK